MKDLARVVEEILALRGLLRAAPASDESRSDRYSNNCVTMIMIRW